MDFIAILVFKLQAWAVVSGKINEHPNDKAKWKTNFRCALHSLKNFEMLEDHSKDQDDQHKVYRIIRPQSELNCSICTWRGKISWL